MNYINKNYVLQPIYNNENYCINDTLSIAKKNREFSETKINLNLLKPPFETI